MKNTIKKIWNFLKDFYSNMLLIEKIMVILMIYVKITNTYPLILIGLMSYIIIDSVLKRIDKKNKQK